MVVFQLLGGSEDKEYAMKKEQEGDGLLSDLGNRNGDEVCGTGSGDAMDVSDILNNTGVMSSGDATRAVHRYCRAQHKGEQE